MPIFYPNEEEFRSPMKYIDHLFPLELLRLEFFFLLFFLPFFSFLPYRPRLLSSSSYIWSSYLT